MKQWAFAIPLVFAGLAACSPVGPSPSPPASGQPASAQSASGQATTGQPASGPAYQAVVISGSNTVGDDIIKIDVSTGAAWIHCCGSDNTAYSSIKDGAGLPPGNYHLISWSQVAPNGDVSWNVYRFDSTTGHTWVFVTGANASASYWSDVNAIQ